MNVYDMAQELDPIKFADKFWPNVYFHRKQREILYSIVDNDETVVVAGNMLGKDFVAGFIALWYFLHPLETRIVTTSVKDDHLRVLWGEIHRYIQTSKYPLDEARGGPLRVLSREIYKQTVRTDEEGNARIEMCPISYLKGMVSQKGEGLAGHHASRTLGIIDEASGVDDEAKDQMDGWCRKYLIFGNPNECQNFFRRAVKEGDILA